MKRVFTATLVASAFAVGLAARTPPQYPSSGETKQKPAPTAKSSTSRTVAVTGCLREGETPGTYTLANAQWDRGGPVKGTTGKATGTEKGKPTTATMANETVQLKPSADVDLKAHVGHKIQVTGTLGSAAGTTGKTPGESGAPKMTPPSSANPTTTSQPESNPSTQTTTRRGKGATKSGTTSGESMTRGPRTVTVTSVKMISESCGD